MSHRSASRRRVVAGGLAALSTLWLPSGVRAQAAGYPNKPIRLIVPFAAGSATDTIGRIFGEKITAYLGQPVVIDNRPGANGTIAALAVAKAPADGYTLLLGTNTTNSAIRSIMKNVPYDPEKDLQPVTLVGVTPMLVAVPKNSQSPIRTLQDYIAAAKKGAVTFANSGTGSVGHLAGALFAGEAGIKLVHVPFKGAPEAQASIVSGEVVSLWNTLGAHVGGLKGGEIRGIAVTTRERSPQFPDIPTVRELGFPDVVVSNWFLLAGPAALPQDIVRRINDAFTAAGKDPKVADGSATLGLQAIPGLNLKNYTDFIHREVTVWGKVMQEHGIRQQ